MAAVSIGSCQRPFLLSSAVQQTRGCSSFRIRAKAWGGWPNRRVAPRPANLGYYWVRPNECASGSHSAAVGPDPLGATALNLECRPRNAASPPPVRRLHPLLQSSQRVALIARRSPPATESLGARLLANHPHLTRSFERGMPQRLAPSSSVHPGGIHSMGAGGVPGLLLTPFQTVSRSLRVRPWVTPLMGGRSVRTGGSLRDGGEVRLPANV
jgi:hypothetical protein